MGHTEPARVPVVFLGQQGRGVGKLSIWNAVQKRCSRRMLCILPGSGPSGRKCHTAANQKKSRRNQTARFFLKARRKDHCRGSNKGTVFCARGTSPRPVIGEAGKLHLVPSSIPKVSSALQGLHP